MSWKQSLSRHLTVLRFFGCPDSPSSRGLISFYETNYEELKMLNPTFPLLMRTTFNAMPAVATELDFTTDDLLKYMLGKQLFRDANGTLAHDRMDAAKAYLQTDWKKLRDLRWSSPGFDPEQPFLDKDWRVEKPQRAADLKEYLELKDAVDEQVRVFQGGPDKEYTRAENAMLMLQRVDLWCAGEKEVEAAVRHLLKLGQHLNDLEPDYPENITEFYPGAEDL